ncbi:MAG: carboxypeptidase regulatory-like domain-containing protein, partial [Acidobacteria bacterium]|nr:carboxypeptidase regulatory-like domain-containing protein [Acidobacteriota bacterium]
MGNVARVLALLFAAAAITPVRLPAQAVSATIFGTVRDHTGAAVPGAVVSVHNVQTNFKRSVNSGGDGGYYFALLPLGQYSLTVEKQGFSQFVQQGITLQVDQQARVDVTLRVGQITEQVLVTAEAPLVNAVNAETSEVVDRLRVEDLPLNGRNFVQLIQLTTGTTPGAPGDSQNNVVINLFRGPTFFTANGMRNMYNNYVLDGVDNNENAFNAGGIVIMPVVDAIQEFKVSTGNFSSEFGRAAGGVVNVQTRSGTNELHGNLFEFLRNSSFDANDFFNNANARSIPDFRQNQFGGTLGGPIRKHSLFVFAASQGWRQRRGLTYLGSVPPAEARTGDFTNRAFPTIYDPLTTRANPSGSGSIRDPFPGNRVPSNRIDPLAPQFLNLMPLPNTNPGAIALNFINNPKWTRGDNQGDVRI